LVRLAELAAVGAPEGTAVVDADGRLVGLCTETNDGSMGLAAVDPAAGELTTSSTSPPASSSPTTEPVLSSAGTTAPTSAPASAPTSAPASAPASASRHG
jgi:hypothetical protein